VHSLILTQSLEMEFHIAFMAYVVHITCHIFQTKIDLLRVHVIPRWYIPMHPLYSYSRYKDTSLLIQDYSLKDLL